MTKHLFTVVGPTAIGKTALSIKIAQHLQCDILSCDSRQFYKEMCIGTAVPETEELAASQHHFIQNRSIFDDYSVGAFERDALKKICELHTRKPNLVMVGGSGMYVNAVLDGLDYFPDVAPEIRTQLNSDLDEKGIENLQEQLLKLDSDSYHNIAIDNPHRLIRALEVCIGSGKSYSSFKNKPKAPRNFKSVQIGLRSDRQLMYERINKRVDIMITSGLLEEARALYEHKSLNALQTVGYRELFMYFDGTISLEFAIEEIKKNTRRFAKRQITWFKKDTTIKWFDYDVNFEEIRLYIDEQLENS